MCRPRSTPDGGRRDTLFVLHRPPPFPRDARWAPAPPSRHFGRATSVASPRPRTSPPGQASVPGNKQSGGKRLSGHSTPGKRWLRATLGQVAWAAVHTHDTYPAALYHRLARRRGKQHAIVAVAHSLLVSIYHMLRTSQPYRGLGPDHLEQLDHARLQRQYVRRLEQLGYAVALSPAEVA